ncbi:hypothetical protein PENSPDRAFT_572201 [Peniophora sp. CONT]|nr:hypothetical protein PENSPDRAFT_572201 [Peniophora sp. CONT]
MDKATSVAAAFNAGKQPSQQQVDAWVDYALQGPLLQIEKSDAGGELSEDGKRLARDLRNIIETYKTYGEHKNRDNLFQEAIWHLRQADIADASLDVDTSVDQQQAKRDSRAIAASLRTSLEVLWQSASIEGSGVFGDFTSFLRLSLADTLDSLGSNAGSAADSLRETEDEVQAGDRNAVGIKRKPEGEPDESAQEKFEKGMDTAKGVGSTVIGAGEQTAEKTKELTERSTNRLREAGTRIAKRASEDQDYRKAIDTVFDLVDKWLHVTGDVAVEGAQSATSLESFINDPTEEQHLIKALKAVRALAENVAGGKSFEPLFNSLQALVIDIRNDPDIQQWTTDFLALLKRNIETVGTVDAEETKTQRQDLRKRWRNLTSEENVQSKKWSDDVDVFRRELKVIQKRLGDDPELAKIQRAHAQFGQDLDELFIDVAATGMQSVIDKAAWAWQDLFNVYLPRAVGLLKKIPIPRTEYKDPETEFVLENLDISTFNLLPGHVFMRNITDIDITAPQDAAVQTAVGSLTHLQIKALQLQLEDISFYYKDKTATVGPSEYTGVVAVKLPPQGVDVDVRFRLIPNTEEGLKKRKAKQAFHLIEKVEVKVSTDAEFEVKQSNHAVLLTVFKPMLNTRLRETLQTVLSEQIRGLLETADHLAYDVSERSQVFADAGLSRGPALTSALWSELGRLRRLPGGILSGWQATGTGAVKDLEGNAKLAVGAEPQILSPEKHGPLATLSEPLADKAKRATEQAADQMDIDLPSSDDAAGAAKNGVEQARQGAKEGLRQVRTFKELVGEKQRMEESRAGWKTDAFDI